MFLKAIKLKNFKKFKELEFDFPSDLIVVKAPNEQGKTTLMKAIIAGLFFDPQKRNKEILDLKSWNSETLPEVVVSFEEKGEDFILSKDFENKKLSLVNKNSGEEENNFRKISDFLYKIAGLRSAKLFEDIAAIRQEILQEINTGKKELDGAILNLITAGETKSNVSDILKKLQMRLDSLRRGLTGRAYKNPGIIRELTDSRKENKNALEESRKEIHRYDQEISLLRSEEKKFDEVETLLKNRQSELKDLEIYFRAQEKLSFFDKELNQVNNEIEALHKIKEEIKKLDNNISQLKKLKAPRLIELKRLPVLMGVIISILGGWALGLILNSILILSAAFILSLVFLLLVIYFPFLITKKVPEADLISLEKEKLLAKEEGMLNKRRYEDFENHKKDLAKEIMIERTRIESLRLDQPSQRQQKLVQKDIDDLSGERERLLKSISRLQARLESSKVNSETLAKLEEEIFNLEEEIKKAERKEKIYDLMAKLLMEAKNKAIEKVRGDLIKYLEKFLRELTAGRYQKAVIDENLNFKIFSLEKGEEIVPDGKLSRGTTDQFYIAIRFAFLKLLNEGKKSLILLDDPFHNFDQDRKLRLRNLLEDFTEDFQIILFTVSDEYDQWGTMKLLTNNK